MANHFFSRSVHQSCFPSPIYYVQRGFLLLLYFSSASVAMSHRRIENEQRKKAGVDRDENGRGGGQKNSYGQCTLPNDENSDLIALFSLSISSALALTLFLSNTLRLLDGQYA